MSDLTPKLTVPLTKKSFTQGDRALFIRDVTIRFMEASLRGNKTAFISDAQAYAKVLWDRFMENLPNE